MHYTYYASHNSAFNSCVGGYDALDYGGYEALEPGDTMPLITGGSSMGMQENWATTLYFLICETNSQRFCMSFMLFDLEA